MSKHFLIIAILACITIGCKTSSIFQESQTHTKQQVPLGSVRLEKDFILQQDFNNTAIPKYEQPIKLSILIKPFTKQIHKSFLKAKTSQSASVHINYIDSLEVRPKFIQFKIADKATLMKALNSVANQGVKDYLSYNKTAKIVSSKTVTGLAPKSNTVVTNKEVIFTWDTVEDAENYKLQIATPNFENAAQIVTDSYGSDIIYKNIECW